MCSRTWRETLPSNEQRRRRVTLPPFIETMLERKWLGDKTGQGFYKKDRRRRRQRTTGSRSTGSTLEYRPAATPEIPVDRDGEERRVAAASVCGCSSPAIRRKTKPRRFYCRCSPASGTTPPTPARDRRLTRLHRPRHARRLQLGARPFEMWDAVGVAETVEAFARGGRTRQSAGRGAARCGQDFLVSPMADGRRVSIRQTAATNRSSSQRASRLQCHLSTRE